MYQQVLLNSRYRSFEEAIFFSPTWSGRYAELIYEWMQASAMAPNFMALEETDLGLRDIDRNHFSSRGLLDNPTIHDKIGFVNTLRQVVQDTHDSGLSTSLPALSRQQQAAHDHILDFFSGGEGTVKSTLINAIVRSTRELFSNDNSVHIMAPTSVDAFNIGGSTIHHELGITADKSQSYKKLETERCRRMQVYFKNTKLIIIDEYSMIGRKMLAYIDLRLRDIFGAKESFGNVSIVISLTLSLSKMFVLNKFSGSLELRSQNIEKLCRD
ncbi:hypothetical protein MKW98_020072 [Papaver atlanticum]|uniref:ATP-dependent DNA helicase n=1 Tax=Papaver atlanticum TaxID=357466 RepID=A0AAD4S160_9MAGN|nr:hypothetical protein MKW98_020072 [Papaver atlanticum]